MFAGKVGSDIDVCDADALGRKLQGGSVSEYGVNQRPPSFDAKEDVFGRKKCKYDMKGGQVGRFSCEGVDEFDCRWSAHRKPHCKDGFDIKKFYAIMDCVFPAK